MTQIESAKKNIITEEMITAAVYENIKPEILLQKIAKGTAVIPKNKFKNLKKITAIGEGLMIKVNANIGTSTKSSCIEKELIKLDMAVAYGVDAVMDLSTGGDLPLIRTRIIENCPVMTGSVPIYSLIAHAEKQKKNLEDLIADDFINELELHLKSGMDFLTVHAGVTRFVINQLENCNRILGIVSRGGALIKKWMQLTSQENPFYSQFDKVITLFKKYDAVISLGDGLRPGAIEDATDRAQIAELIELGCLAQRAHKNNVQVMIEGPGHVPYNEIPANIKLIKKLCNNAPIYVLGPLPTDISSGYDHITGAIGATSAAVNGADFLCYLTPAEHLCLPDVNDVKQGVIASKIAAHIGNMERRVGNAKQADHIISKARKALDWNLILKSALDPEYSRERKGNIKEECSMCGQLCAIKNAET